jgi:hypothetical protein
VDVSGNSFWDGPVPSVTPWVQYLPTFSSVVPLPAFVEQLELLLVLFPGWFLSVLFRFRFRFLVSVGSVPVSLFSGPFLVVVSDRAKFETLGVPRR